MLGDPTSTSVPCWRASSNWATLDEAVAGGKICIRKRELQHPSSETRVARQPKKRLDFVGRIDGEAGKFLADRGRKLGAVTRAGRGDDQAGIRPAIDNELLTLIRPTVGVPVGNQTRTYR